jgi:ornithine cyclodeaminase/alanine dehydrogenase-like protein (mu-crystallin family)
LRPAECRQALERAFAAAGARAVTGHRALGCDLPGGAFHAKAFALELPADDRLVFVIKINANFPDNPERGLPTIQGVAALFDGREGRLLALLDSGELTARRTAAATAIAARRLARADARRLLICGCGRQGAAHLEALAAALTLERIALYDLDPARAERLAEESRRRHGLETRAVEAFEPAARESDVVVACTTSRAPWLGAHHLAPGAFVAAVGSDHPSKQELEPELVAGARLAVDSPAQAAECGELRHAIAAGLAGESAVAARLDQLVTGEHPGRSDPDETWVFDSTGLAIEDAAAALLAWERARCTDAVPSLDLSA